MASKEVQTSCKDEAQRDSGWILSCGEAWQGKIESSGIETREPLIGFLQSELRPSASAASALPAEPSSRFF